MRQDELLLVSTAGAFSDAPHDAMLRAQASGAIAARPRTFPAWTRRGSSARGARVASVRARAVAARARSSTSPAAVVGLGSWRRTSDTPSPPALVPRAAHGASVPTPRPTADAPHRPSARDPRARAARPSSAPDGTPDPAEEHGTAIHPDAMAQDTEDANHATDAEDAEKADEAEDAEEAEDDEDDEDEYEEVEVEVEVDYTPLDHARDAVESLGTWRDVASWSQPTAPDATDADATADASSVLPTPGVDAAAFAASAVAPMSASASGGLPMAPASGLAVALALVVGAVFGRDAAEERSKASAGVLAELIARAGGGGGGGGSGGGVKVMTEEERVADEKRKAEKAEKARVAELARRKKRDEDEAKFVAAEKARLQREAEEAEKARKAEEERRAKVRAELAERAEIERVYAEEKRAAEEAERARREAEAAAEMERKRKEEAERQARVAAERAAARERRGETSKGFDASMSVGFAYRAGRNEVEYSLRLRAGISAPATAVATLPTSESARVAALNACTEAARAAISAYASDQRAKRMMGDACPIGLESGGFDDVEFDHWMRVAQARLDAELRQLVSRAAAGLELTLRQPGGTASDASESREAELRVERAALPQTDYDNVSNRLVAAASAAADEAYGAATEDLDWVTRYELGQLHGMDGGLVFPAVTANDGKENQLKGVLVATMLNLSHWLARARSLAPDDEELLERCEELSGRILNRVANAEGSSWKAMYLDGFSGDVLAQACATARALLPDGDPVRAFLAKAEEEQRRKLAGVPTIDEDAYPDREEARKMRFRAEQEAIPLAEKLWAMRNSAAQMSQSGARGQARTILEEAYRLRAEATAKRREEQGVETPRGYVAPELLPELVALEDCFAGEASWAKELAGVRSQILKAVRAAAEREAAEDNWRRAAALLEGAAREYGAARKLGEEHPAVVNAKKAAEEAWAGAGVAPDDEDAKDAAMEETAGTKVPRGQGGGIVLKLTKGFLEELEVRRK